MPDYERIIKNLTPEAQRLLQQKLQGANVPSEETVEPQTGESYWAQTGKELLAPFTEENVPFWKRGLAGFALPFSAVSEYAIKPLAAIATSPFTKEVEGTEGKNWLERELTEYKAWDDPNWKFIGVKGALEFLPWLLVPGVGIAAKGTGIAGQLAKLGTAGKIAGTALEKSPWGLAEQAAGKAMGAVGKGIKAAIGKKAPEVSVGVGTTEEFSALAKEGLAATQKPTITIDEFAQQVSKEAKIPVDFVDKSWHDSRFSIKYGQPYLEVGTKNVPKNVDRDNFLKLVSLHELGHKLGTVRKVGLDAEEEAWRFVAANAQRFDVDLSGATKVIKSVHPEYGNEAIMGRFVKPSVANKIVDVHNKSGGSTFDVAGRSLTGKPEYAIGAYPDRAMEVPGAKITKEQVDDFAFRNSDLLSQPNHTIGTWYDQSTGNTVFDISVTRDNLEVALDFAKQKGQKAIYDLKNNKEIPVAAELDIRFANEKVTHLGKQASKESGKPNLPADFLGEQYSKATPLLINGREVGQVTMHTSEAIPDTLIVDALRVTETGLLNRSFLTRINALIEDLAKKNGLKKVEIVSLPSHKVMYQKAGYKPTTSVAGDAVEKLLDLGMSKGVPVGSQAMPGGFTTVQENAINKIVTLIKTSKPLRKKTEEMYTKEQASRISAYEDTVEKLTNEGLDPESALMMATKELEGKFPQASTAELDALRNMMQPKEVQELFSVIRDGTYQSGYDRLNTSIALQNMLLNKMPTTAEIKLLEETFGSILAKELLKQRPFMTKAREFLIDLANAPRALLASTDISGLLRQGGVLSAAHPIEALKTVRPMVEALFSSKNETLMDRIIRARPNFALAEKYGLYIAPLTTKISVKLAEREEVMMSRLMNKIPFVRASNRAYVTGLNDLRTRIWEKTLGMWKKAREKALAKGDTATAEKLLPKEQDFKDLAQLINWATGRGTMPKALAQQGALLNAMFFSPRLIFSRLELPMTVFPAVTKSALVRKEAMKTLLTAVGVGASILTAAQLSGAAKVELDPRSADFGKMKIGETRLDIWTGYAQYTRFAAQLATGQRKTQSGYIQSMTRKDIVDRFAQTKFSPAVGLINDLLKGETYLGEDLPPKSAKNAIGQLYQRLMPLSVQDLIDGYAQDGALGAFTSSVGILGLGVVTYTDDVKKARDAAARDEYGMNWEELGLKYGRAAQMRLEQTDNRISEAEKEQEQRYTVSSISNMKQWQNEGQAIEDTYRQAISLADKEFRDTKDGVTFRNKVTQAANVRRQMFASRSNRKEYQSIVDYYNRPLTQDQISKMNPGDFARRQFYQMMYGADMYDQYGNYLFDLAEKREQEFLLKYGQQSLDYIEEYQGSRWLDKPMSLQMLERAKDVLQPYWQITDYVWSLYAPEVKAMSDQITLLERTDPERAREALKRYPRVLRARELIATYKKAMKDGNPAIRQAFSIFYG